MAVTVVVDHPGPREPLRFFEYPNQEAAERLITALVKPTQSELVSFMSKGGDLTSINGEVKVIGVHPGNVASAKKKFCK